MKRFSAVAMLALASLATLAAQAPKGWKMRVDRSPLASDPDAAGDISSSSWVPVSMRPIRRPRCTGIRPTLPMALIR